MQRHDDSISAAGAGPGGPPLRGDVRSARSRMRTKYGSQLQIVELAGLLADTETLRFMAVAKGPALPDRNNHGLLGLSDSRLLFVPKSSAYHQATHTLASIRALMWVKYGRFGTLTVLGEGYSSSYSDLATADARELI